MATRDRVSSVLTWQAPEFFYYPKTTRWYAVALGLGVVAVIALRLAGELDWTNGLLVAAALFALIRLANRPPRTIQVRIEQTGIAVGETAMPYDQLASFHVTNHGTHLTLDFQTKKMVFPISAVINGQDPDTVREVVGRYLPERTTGTGSIADLMSRWLHF